MFATAPQMHSSKSRSANKLGARIVLYENHIIMQIIISFYLNWCLAVDCQISLRYLSAVLVVFNVWYSYLWITGCCLVVINFFQEVDLGLMADIGTIQRLPKLIGNVSLVRELVYTARKFTADEALKLGMVRWEISSSLWLFDSCCSITVAMCMRTRNLLSLQHWVWPTTLPPRARWLCRGQRWIWTTPGITQLTLLWTMQ